MKGLAILAFPCVFLGLPLGAQSIADDWAAFTPQGASARAVGIGGAFTAVADDATAVSFNPAGLAQLLKPEISFVGMRSEKTVTQRGEGLLPSLRPYSVLFNGSTNRQNEPLFASVTLPWKKWDRNFVFQLSSQRLFEMEAHSTGALDVVVGGQRVRRDTSRMDVTGGINMRSVALAAELSPRVMLGLSFNLWQGHWISEDELGLEQVVEDGIYRLRTRIRSDDHIRGVNWTLGGMWRFEYVTFSAVYRTPFHADLETVSRTEIFEPEPLVEDASSRLRVRWPETLALGLALRPHPRWLIAADLARTEWTKARYDAPGHVLDGKNFFAPEHPETVHDTVARRIGVEYIPPSLGGVLLPLRAGYFHEPQFNSDVLSGHQRVFKGWTVGAGLRFRNAWVDVAYKSTRGTQPTGARLAEGQEVVPITLTKEMREKRLYVSFTIQFTQEFQRRLLRWLFVEG